MTRESESELLSFCAAQRGDLHADAWTQFDRVEKREMAAVCLFLAGVDWFGHEGGLRDAAKKLLGGAETTFGALARALIAPALPIRSKGGSAMHKLHPEPTEAMSRMMDRIDAFMRESGYTGEPVKMYHAGGMAVHYHCGTRYTDDVDATFSERLMLPFEELVIDQLALAA